MDTIDAGDELDVLLVPKEVAARIRLSPATLSTLRCRGGGPPFRKFGTKVVYPASGVAAWVAARPLQQSASTPEAKSGKRGRPARKR